MRYGEKGYLDEATAEVWKLKKYDLAVTICPRMPKIGETELEEAIWDSVDLANKRLHHKTGLSIVYFIEHQTKVGTHAHGLMRFKRQLTRNRTRAECLEVLEAALRTILPFAEDLSIVTKPAYDLDRWIGYATKQYPQTPMPIVA